MKATAIAHSNTALIKYWGKKDEKLIIPMNNSISLTLDSLFTKTTVEFSKEISKDEFYLNNSQQKEKPLLRVIKHLDLIRKLTNNKLFARIYSENNFPTASGLASSASGFAALTLAACSALNQNKKQKELSMISRQGSGSSSRSIYGGYVEWIAQDENNESYTIQLADQNWFDIRDLVLVLESGERKINTREAMKLSKETSPFYKTRIEEANEQLVKMRKAIKNKNFQTIGKIAEQDCLSMHATALTSNPPMIFWSQNTVRIIHLIQELRTEGKQVYFTIDTGANMHILTLPKYENKIYNHLKNIAGINEIIKAKPGPDAKIIDEHLF